MVWLKMCICVSERGIAALSEELHPCCLLIYFLTESVDASPLLFQELDCERCEAPQFLPVQRDQKFVLSLPMQTISIFLLSFLGILG